MTYCDQCGSASIGLDGFCGGCGAHYTNAQLGTKNQASEPKVAKPVNPLGEVQIPHMQLAVPREKNIWVAILLTFFFGPLGLVYCSFVGAIVMTAVAVVLRIFFGTVAFYIIWAACIFWSWRVVKTGSDGWNW
jgi:hypothetical protein